jgi:hypothetical protein
VSKPVEQETTCLVERDETSTAYEPPVLIELGRFGAVTQGGGTYQPEGSSGFMV